jgi:hypothetical protein
MTWRSTAGVVGWVAKGIDRDMDMGVRGERSTTVAGGMRVVRRLEVDTAPKRFPMAASKLLSSSVLVTGARWLVSPPALEKKPSMF